MSCNPLMASFRRPRIHTKQYNFSLA